MTMQVLRRTVQILVVLFLIGVPIVNYYGVKVEQIDNEAIEASFTLSLVDKAFRDADRDTKVSWSHRIKGSVWAAELFGYRIVDPLAALESTTTSFRFYAPLFLAALVPILLTLLLGRVFCGWICPMHLLLEVNDALRRLLRKTGYNVRNIRFSRRTKYAVLIVGLFVAFFASIPVLSLIYPPAILSREVFYKVYGGAFGLGLWIILAIAFFELILSRRWWCRYVCPGGAVYSALAAARRLRIVRNDEKCDQCGDCVPVCPYDLRPMTQVLTSECDQCGKCISVCAPEALKYTFRLRGATQ